MEKRSSRKEILPVFAAVVILTSCLYAVMTAVQPTLSGNPVLKDFGSVISGCMTGDPISRIYWYFADITEGNFVAALSAAVPMILVGFLAAWLETKGSKWAGSGVDGNGRIFSRMAVTGLLSPILAQLVFGGLFQIYGWIPTFAGFVVVQILITKYGVKLPQLVTTLILGTVITFPLCLLFMLKITMPLGLPTFLSVAYGFVLAVPICCEICNRLPWMKASAQNSAPAEESGTVTPYVPTPTGFFLNRVFGDVGELVVWGSSIATMASYLGGTIGWLINPLHPAYAAGNWPTIMCGQILTAALAVFLWYPKYQRDGWYFTFTAVIFASAVFVTYSNSLLVVIPTILVAAIIVPPFMHWLMKITKYQGRYPAIVCVQTAVGITCTLWCFFLMHVYLPALGL